jgi:2-isopropylmalate synthase
MLWREYVERTEPWKLVGFRTEHQQDGTGDTYCWADVLNHGLTMALRGRGNGAIDAFVHALNASLPKDKKFHVANYAGHALGSGEDAQAIAYFQVREDKENGQILWGSAVDTDTETASVKAVLSALNRLEAKQPTSRP